VSDYLTELTKAILATHGTPALHVDTVPVREMFQGKVAWEGDVEVFAVSRGSANTCYAWGVRRDDDKGWDVTAVLGVPPVTTPQLAVKAAIAAHAKQAASLRPGKS
jgi:hypothetical protein